MKKYILFILILFVISSCFVDKKIMGNFDSTRSSFGKENGYNRVQSKESRNVLLLYIAGFNTLSDFLKQNVNDLTKGYLPGNDREDNILLVFSKLSPSNSSFGKETAPVLFRMYKHANKVVMDTLLTLPSETIAASPKTLNFVLNYIHKYFPAKSYGMILSSHASGWLPNGVYTGLPISEPPIVEGLDNYMFVTKSTVNSIKNNNFGKPKIKNNSLTQEENRYSPKYTTYEINISDFAKAIPYKLDYMFMDVCLAGGIEVAYELKDKVRFLEFSPAEVLAEGLPFTSIGELLLAGTQPRLREVCELYYQHYANMQEDWKKSATVSLIDCSKLEPLKDVCSALFEKYRDNIYSLNPESQNVQIYFRFRKHWFYDLEDILIKSGIDTHERDMLSKALDECILYKASTENFIGGSSGFRIHHYSGLSMYLPSVTDYYNDTNATEINNFYKTLEWNKATNLVR